MSYILDALKRSEQERHQGELTPTTIDTIMYKPKPVKHQWWPYLLIFILIINLAVYLYFQFADRLSSPDERIESQSIEQPKLIEQQNNRFSQTQSMASTAEPEKQIISPDRASGTPPVKALPKHLQQTPSLNRVYDVNQVRSDIDQKVSSSNSWQAPTPVNEPLKSQPHTEYNADGFEVIRPKQTVVTQTADLQIEVPVKTEPAQPELQSIPENYELIEPSSDISSAQVSPEDVIVQKQKDNEAQRLEQVPHLNDLSGSFQASIPDIRFNSHIYSDQPAERRVMINDLYLREGQSFSGMRIETIGEYYIELEKQGQHFKLPVLRDWYSPR